MAEEEEVHCGYCGKFKPVSEMRWVETGRGSTRRKKRKCVDCIAGGKAPAAERDKAGKAYAAETRSKRSRMLKSYTEAKKKGEL